MDANVILSAIGSVGFPIVACCALFYLYDKTISKLTSTLDKVTTTLDKMDNTLERVMDKIDNLEKKGLVARSVAKDDRRVNNIVVTAEGMALKDSTKQLAIDTMNKALEGIPEEDLQTFVTVLKKVCGNISDFGKQTEPW